MKIEVTSSLPEIDHKLQPLFESVQLGDIVLVTGSVGAGKTTFVRHFVSHMSDQMASSPSYNLIQEYPIKNGKVIHVDLYRVKDESDLESVGFWDALNQPNFIGFIEWPEMLKTSDLVAKRILKLDIQIDKNSPDLRHYSLILTP